MELINLFEKKQTKIKREKIQNVRIKAEIDHCGSCSRGVKLIFSGGHISLVVAFKGPNVISTP